MFFILYSYDLNAILSKSIKNIQGSVIHNAWRHCYTKLKTNGYAPDLHLLENECSNDMKSAFTKQNVSFQRVPPHIHQRNAAERAIQTWKKHFIAGLCGTDTQLTIHLFLPTKTEQTNIEFNEKIQMQPKNSRLHST